MTTRRLWAILILLPLTLVLAGCPCPLPPPAAFDQIEARVEATDGQDSFALSDLENLPTWDRLHLFAPYTSTPDIEAQLGFPWPDADHFDLDQRDDIYLAVFAHENQVVAVGEWPRGRFELDESLFVGLSPEGVVHIERGDGLARLLLEPPPASPEAVAEDSEGNHDEPTE